jgi:hypothetical protein
MIDGPWLSPSELGTDEECECVATAIEAAIAAAGIPSSLSQAVLTQLFCDSELFE